MVRVLKAGVVDPTPKKIVRGPRPLVGVSANRFAPDPQRPVFKNMELHYAEANLVNSVYRAGGLPLIIPDLRSETALEEFLDRLDGIVLAGGADVSPETYGRKNYDPKWPGDKVRDAYEIALVKRAEEKGKPIFGVCRGMQLLNVAFGGTLYQDITTEKKDSLIHRDWDKYEQNVHTVNVEKGSWLEKLYGKAIIRVNTVHHQGVRDLAKIFRATAHAPDGVVEAIEERTGRWIRGVQWHPEWHPLDKQGIDDLEVVFRDFVESCRPAKLAGSRNIVQKKS
jgi:putative glutamine amidotransferase